MTTLAFAVYVFVRVRGSCGEGHGAAGPSGAPEQPPAEGVIA